MRFILLLTIILLSSCQIKKETIAKKQQAIKNEIEQVKAYYYKKLDSLDNIKRSDTSSAKHHEIAVEIFAVDGKRSIIIEKKGDKSDPASLGKVIGEELGPEIGSLAEMRLERGGDRRVDALPLRPEDGVVDRVAQERVFEGEARDRRQRDPVDHVRVLEPRERRAQDAFAGLRGELQ